MKQRILNMMLMAFVCSTMALAQQVKEGELAVFYHMPLTQLAITIEYDEIATTPGPFYLYAERYMGAKEVVTEAQKRYEVTNVTLHPHTVADLIVVIKCYLVLKHNAYRLQAMDCSTATMCLHVQ